MTVAALLSACPCSSYDRRMSIRLWRPLNARLAGKSVSTIATSVPSDALEPKLRQWIEEAIYYEEDAQRVAIRLDIPEAPDDVMYLSECVAWEDLYDVIDAALDLGLGDESALKQLLDDALSAYTVAPDGRGLIARADPTATAALGESIKSASSRKDAGPISPGCLQPPAGLADRSAPGRHHHRVRPARPDPAQPLTTDPACGISPPRCRRGTTPRSRRCA